MGLMRWAGLKVLGGVLLLGVIAGGYSWYAQPAEVRAERVEAAVDHTGRIVAWTAAVVLIPWATFFLPARVAKMDSNTAGAALVMGVTAAEAALLAWLWDWSIAGAVGWTFFAVGVLGAAVYNVLTMDWIAEKLTT